MFERALWKLRLICWLCFGKTESYKEIEKLKVTKDRLRIALFRAGYDIMGVQRMEDWIEIINERTAREMDMLYGAKMDGGKDNATD